MRILFLGFSGLAVDNIVVFKDDAMLNQSLIQSYNLIDRAGQHPVAPRKQPHCGSLVPWPCQATPSGLWAGLNPGGRLYYS
jgi:hypothetical protein